MLQGNRIRGGPQKKLIIGYQKNYEKETNIDECNNRRQWRNRKEYNTINKKKSEFITFFRQYLLKYSHLQMWVFELNIIATLY